MTTEHILLITEAADDALKVASHVAHHDAQLLDHVGRQQHACPAGAYRQDQPLVVDGNGDAADARRPFAQDDTVGLLLDRPLSRWMSGPIVDRSSA